MKAIISTTIYVSGNKMWEKLKKTSSLMYIASPVLTFKSLDRKPPSTWEVDEKYSYKLYAFHLIPLGKHDVIVKRKDSKNKEILTNEFGSLTKTWNHLLRIDVLAENIIKYTDEIEIKAGILTVFIWMFAHYFYRHRQRKWKKLLRPGLKLKPPR